MRKWTRGELCRAMSFRSKVQHYASRTVLYKGEHCCENSTYLMDGFIEHQDFSVKSIKLTLIFFDSFSLVKLAYCSRLGGTADAGPPAVSWRRICK